MPAAKGRQSYLSSSGVATGAYPMLGPRFRSRGLACSAALPDSLVPSVMTGSLGINLLRWRLLLRDRKAYSEERVVSPDSLHCLTGFLAKPVVGRSVASDLL
jgi:hypothetical protein